MSNKKQQQKNTNNSPKNTSPSNNNTSNTSTSNTSTSITTTNTNTSLSYEPTAGLNANVSGDNAPSPLLVRSTSVQFAQDKVVGSYKRNVIFDTDMGWDDVLSLCLLVKNPNVNLIGVCVTGLGEAHRYNGMRNAKRILKEACLGHIPVVPGANKSLSPYSNVFPEKDFRNIMDDLNFDKKDPLLDRLKFPKLTQAEEEEINVPREQNQAAKFMRDQLNITHGNQTTIISTGGLTDIAHLFRLQDVNFRNIERIVIMGGAVDGVDGNIAALNNRKPEWDQGRAYSSNTVAEWNIFLDPVAAREVFQNKPNVPLVLVPLNACNNVLLSADVPKLVVASDRIAKLCRGILEGQLQNEPSIPIFDPLATLIATENVRQYSHKWAWIDVPIVQTTNSNIAGQTIVRAPEPGHPYFRNVKIILTASSVEFTNSFTYLVNTPPPNEVDVAMDNPDKMPKQWLHPVKKTVGIIVFDKIEMFDYCGIFQVFASARQPRIEGSNISFSRGTPAFNVISIAQCKNLCKLTMTSGDSTPLAESNLSFTPNYSFDDEIPEQIDVLVVIGGQGVDAVMEDKDILKAHVDFIKKVSKTAEYVCGICSGAVLLAQTGLLNNLEVTTHHARFTQLHQLSIDNDWNLTVVDTRLGRNFVHNPISKFMTSGGVHCSIACALHVLELYMGYRQVEYVATEVMEYSVPIGDFVFPKELEQYHSYLPDPRHFLKGFSHLNVIVPDVRIMEEATDFYRSVLGFQEAWSVWLAPEAKDHFVVDAGLYTQAQLNKMKENGELQQVNLLVRFLIHPNIQMHIELMMYTNISDSDRKMQPTFLKTYDVGGIRHVALEVDNCKELWHWLRKNHPEVNLLQKQSEPQVLYPDTQTFFYFQDPYGVQWEFEQGRPIAVVIKGVVG